MGDQILRVFGCLVGLFAFYSVLSEGQLTAGEGSAIRAGRPGTVLIDKGRPHWASNALDELAERAEGLLIHCRPIQTSRLNRLGASSASIELPDGAAGMRQLATLAGYEVVDLGPSSWLLREGGDDCDAPITVFAEQLALGQLRWDTSIKREELEQRFLRAADAGVRMLDSIGPTYENFFGTHYWASLEGHGREFYVLQQMASGRPTRFPPGRYLRKVEVDQTGSQLSLRDLWSTENRRVSILVPGDIADVELDFDGDQVIDVVTFSAQDAGTHVSPPLHVLSGKTGREVATLEGYEFLITETAAGRKAVMTMDTTGYRLYQPASSASFVLASKTESDPTDDEALRRLESIANASKRLRNMETLAAARVADHFIMPSRPAALSSRLLTGVRRLKGLTRPVIFAEEVNAGRKARTYVLYQPEAARKKAAATH